MHDLAGSFAAALTLMLNFDASLVEIVSLSLRVSLTAVLVASVFGFVIGAWLALNRFPGYRLVLVVINALMGLPPVVVGLCIYLLLSRSGPFGQFGLLFTPSAMIIAQCVLVIPLMAALTRQIIADLWLEYHDQLLSLGVRRMGALRTLLWEGRFSLLTVLLAGFGRAVSEVGAVLIVGGNIIHHTRVMTTAIALETAKGNLALALGLGIILIMIACVVNGVAFITKGISEYAAG